MLSVGDILLVTSTTYKIPHTKCTVSDSVNNWKWSFHLICQCKNRGKDGEKIHVNVKWTGLLLEVPSSGEQIDTIFFPEKIDNIQKLCFLWYYITFPV